MAGPKVSIRVSADPEQIKWVDEQVEAGIYSSRSQAYRYAMSQLKKLQEMKSNIN